MFLAAPDFTQQLIPLNSTLGSTIVALLPLALLLVLLAVMRAPRTFTREDVVEITCHGGLLPAKMVLDAALHSGATQSCAEHVFWRKSR